MTLFFSVLGAAALGTFFGNLGVFWVIGSMAQKAQKKQIEEIKKQQEAFVEMRQKEVERMQRYAKMEG